MDIALSEKSKNSYDGTITVLAEDEKAVVNLDNITVVNEKKGYISGNISFEVEEQAYNLALTADENSQTIYSCNCCDLLGILRRAAKNSCHSA